MTRSTTPDHDTGSGGLGLPIPSEAERARSAELCAEIAEAIREADGSLPFDRYMELALYAPGLGYYSGGASQFGEGGDFITAPEVSPLFAQALARQCASVLAQVHEGVILELGAGTGKMAGDLLAALLRLGRLPARYYILETSAALRARQKDYLHAQVPQWADRFEWLEDWPKGLRGVAIANEVLDAQPVRCFKIGPQGVLERRVTARGGTIFGWNDEPAEPLLSKQVAVIGQDLTEPLPIGYCSEVHSRLEPWIQQLSVALEQGVAFLVDYGYPRREYYHPQRSQGTLICHYRHRAHADPFFYPGPQDISANVDFTAVAEAAERAAMSLLGYTSQAHFVLANGLENLVPNSEDTLTQLKAAQQIKQLTLPAEMGERFQVIALGNNYPFPLQRFALRDLRFRL